MHERMNVTDLEPQIKEDGGIGRKMVGSPSGVRNLARPFCCRD